MFHFLESHQYNTDTTPTPQMNDASTSDIGDTVIIGPLVPTSGQWCTQCGMHCINEGECYTFLVIINYQRIKIKWVKNHNEETIFQN